MKKDHSIEELLEKLQKNIHFQNEKRMFSKVFGYFKWSVIENEGNWYIFQARESVIKPDYEDADTLVLIRSYMEREEMGIIEDYLIGQTEKMVQEAHNSSFEEAATLFGAERGETGFIAPVYGNVSFVTNSPGNKKEDSLLSAAAFSDEFFEKVFALNKVGEISSPMILDRSVVVFTLMAEQEGASYPEEYKTYIRSNLTNELARYKQDQEQAVFLNSPKLKNYFDKTYNKIFPES